MHLIAEREAVEGLFARERIIDFAQNLNSLS